MDFKALVSFLIKSFLTPAATLLVAAAVVFFLWNIMQVIRNSDNAEELAKFKSKAVWGIVAIAVMVSLWGLVNFVTKSANLNLTPVIIPELTH